MDFLITFCVGAVGVVCIYSLLCLIGVSTVLVILKTIKNPYSEVLESAQDLRAQHAAWYRLGYAGFGVLGCVILLVAVGILYGIAFFGSSLIRSF